MNARDRRTLIAGGIAMLAIMLTVRVVPAVVRAAAEARNRTQERLNAVRRTREVLAAESQTRDSLQRTLVRFVGLAPRLLAGRTRSEAAGTLVSWVTGAASRASLRLRRVESLPDSGVGTVRPVAVHAELEGDIAGLSGFLRDAEGGMPLLTVKTLAVVTVNPVDRATTETLRLEVTLSGWYLGPVAQR